MNLERTLPAVSVARVAQRSPGYGTTLPSTLRKVDES